MILPMLLKSATQYILVTSASIRENSVENFYKAFILQMLIMPMSLLSAHAEKWDLNDVSVMFPLPTKTTDSSYLMAVDFIPRVWFAEVLAENNRPFMIAPRSMVQIATEAEISRMKEDAHQLELERAHEFKLKEDALDQERTAVLARRGAPDLSESEKQVIRDYDVAIKSGLQPRQQMQQLAQNIQGTEYITAAQWADLSVSEYQSIRLLAFRIDPCFRDRFEDNCRHQIRAVWQPISRFGGTEDAAIHTFYNLPDAEFLRFTRALSSLKLKHAVSTHSAPLGIHPGFEKSNYLKDVLKLLKKTLNENSISRVAFLRVTSSDAVWDFRSFDVKEKSLIPILPVGSQSAVMPVVTLQRGSSIVDPANIPAFRGLNDLQIIRRAGDLENPRKHLPGTVDCVSCHTASTEKVNSLRNLGLNSSPTIAAALKLRNHYNLKNTTHNRTDGGHFRAFGYVSSDPSISDRVIYESALVADQLNN